MRSDRGDVTRLFRAERTGDSASGVVSRSASLENTPSKAPNPARTALGYPPDREGTPSRDIPLESILEPWIRRYTSKYSRRRSLLRVPSPWW